MRKSVSYIYALAFISTLVQPVLVSGQPTFIHIGQERGLSSLQIGSLYQDSYGFVWIGTPHGLNRFDGYGCVQYFNLPGDTSSISSSHISTRAFWEDKHGNLWVATFSGGLNFFDRNKEQFIRYRADEKQPNSISMDKLFAIEPDGSGGLWIATAGRGFNHYDPNAKKFRVWDADDQNPNLLMGSTMIGCLKLAKNNTLWIGTNKGVCRFDTIKKTFEYFPFSPGDKKSLSDWFVKVIMEDRKGNIWLGTANGLNRWNPGKSIFEKYYPADFFPDKPKDLNYILDILEDDEGKLWLGTQGGLLKFNPGDAQFERFSMPKGPVNTIMKDRDGNIWLGTNNGISVINKAGNKLKDDRFFPIQQVFQQITQTEGINAVLELNNTLYLATQTGIYGFEYGHPVKAKFSGNFTSLFFDKEKKEIYAGTLGNGFYVFDAEKFTQKKHVPKSKTGDSSDPSTVKGNRINYFAKDVQGFIWIAADGCLNRYDPVEGRIKKFHDKEKQIQNPSTNTNQHLLTDRKGNLWIATMGGLSMLSGAELSKPFGDNTLHFKHYQHQPGNKKSISSNVVFCLLESRDGHIWVGTDAGLNRYDPGNNDWQWYFKTDGLPSNEVAVLVEDQNGDIWAGSPHEGLAKFEQSSDRFYRYSLKDGLHTDRFRPNAGLCTSDGFVILGGRTGLVGFNPDSLKRQKVKTSPFYFTDFKILNQPVPIGNKINQLSRPVYQVEHIELDYDQKVLSFQFSALNFVSPEKQVYRYRLIPFHGEWQYNGNNREVAFTNLDPGRYQLRVETSENGYDWSEKTWTLRIRPPWYRTWWAYFLYTLTIAGILYAIRRFELRRQKAKAEAIRLKELDLAKSRLYTNITHEFRTPLTVILGMEEQVRKDPANWFDNGMELIRRNGQQLLQLVNQMLDLSKLESGHLPLKLIRGDVISYLHYLTESFHSYAESKDIRLYFRSDMPHLDMDYDPEKLQNILSNLLSNAIKFTPAGGEVQVEVQITKPHPSEILIQVADNGPGIPAGHLPHIFDRFYQVDDSTTRKSEGTGVGLALVKELVRLMDGSITAASEHGEGASFQIRLPVTRSAPQSQTTTPIIQNETLIGQTHDAQEIETDDRYTLLLVEDNPDVAVYLSSILAIHYRILSAQNGQEGIEKAFEHVPDIIVSDVMMPVKDGFALCRELKTDERTSHIPIVLLTAKADQGAKMEGLTYGADVYLSKPFNQEELLLQIDKLIVLRRQLQAYYKTLGQIQQTSVPTLPGLDDRFMQKVVAVIGSNMADEDFGMPELCAALNMSRSNLFRKLKALTGDSVTGLIRSERLKKAKILLEQTDMNVTEVCFAVGFNSPNYFSRIFQEAFGIAPSEARRR